MRSFVIQGVAVHNAALICPLPRRYADGVFQSRAANVAAVCGFGDAPESPSSRGPQRSSNCVLSALLRHKPLIMRTRPLVHDAGLCRSTARPTSRGPLRANGPPVPGVCPATPCTTTGSGQAPRRSGSSGGHHGPGAGQQSQDEHRPGFDMTRGTGASEGTAVRRIFPLLFSGFGAGACASARPARSAFNQSHGLRRVLHCAKAAL